jgi:hypothetical protein
MTNWNASGKLSVVQAGQLPFNTDTGELLKFTPKHHTGFRRGDLSGARGPAGEPIPRRAA